MSVIEGPPPAAATGNLCPGDDLDGPVVAAWGAGVKLTAMIIELVRRGEAPGMVLLAAMPEQPHTMALIPVFRAWMDAHGVANEIVEYQVKRVKHWPRYNDLLEACLTNGTLPSIAFGLHSCSARHKISPQDKWVKHWQPARRAWERGQKVTRLIGYDCSARDNQRYAHREGHASELYHYRYPLREWGWTREDCERCIADAGLPPFGKSSCFFCTGMQPDEVRAADGATEADRPAGSARGTAPQKRRRALAALHPDETGLDDRLHPVGRTARSPGDRCDHSRRAGRSR